MNSTFLEAAMAYIQTVMQSLEDLDEGGERECDAYCELEVAFARVKRARNLLS